MQVYFPGPDIDYRIEDELHDIYDAEVAVVAVEVFDHEIVTGAQIDNDTLRKAVLADIPPDRGAWVVGTEPEVMAYIEKHGYTDWEVQYELRHPGMDEQ